MFACAIEFSSAKKAGMARQHKITFPNVIMAVASDFALTYDRLGVDTHATIGARPDDPRPPMGWTVDTQDRDRTSGA
jgi:hypothetical protein